MQVGLAKYAQQYPDVDQLVFEPNDDDGEMFFTNVFSFDSRQRVCEHAYQSTLQDLRKRKAALAPVLAKHGLKLRDDVLNAKSSSITQGLQKPLRQTDATARLRRALDDIEHSMRAR
jgi:NTE family protein